MIKIRPDLELKIDEIRSKINTKTYWTEVTRMQLPDYPKNPYARVEVGAILSNGLHERRIGYYTIYYDGTILKTSNL